MAKVLMELLSDSRAHSAAEMAAATLGTSVVFSHLPFVQSSPRGSLSTLHCHGPALSRLPTESLTTAEKHHGKGEARGSSWPAWLTVRVQHITCLFPHLRR